jgi:hypothetical protein
MAELILVGVTNSSQLNSSGRSRSSFNDHASGTKRSLGELEETVPLVK